MCHWKRFLLLVLAVISVLLLVECDQATETAPALLSPLSPLQSPGETPVPDAEGRGPVFNIDEPLRPGDTDVSGVGPAGMDIVIVNASLMSQEIGKGTVGRDGKFAIEVSPPLLAGHRIGIVSQTTLSQEEVERVGGDGMRFLGRGGWLLESALVEDE